MNIDVMDALNGFEDALNRREIHIQPGDVDQNISVHLDRPDGVSRRFTYAFGTTGEDIGKDFEVACVAVMVEEPSRDGISTWGASYAVAPRHRKQGFGTNIFAIACRELHAGLQRNGTNKVRIVVVIDEDNTASIRIAEKFFGPEGQLFTSHDGSKVFRYEMIL